MRPGAGLLLALVLALAGWHPAVAADRPLVIGYLELEDDPRYEERHVAARFPAHPWGRPFDGARVALEESDFAGTAAGVKFELRRVTAADVDALLAALQQLHGAGARFFLLDAPDEAVAALAQKTRG